MESLVEVQHGTAAPDDHGGAGHVAGAGVLVEGSIELVERSQDLRPGPSLPFVTGVVGDDRPAHSLDQELEAAASRPIVLVATVHVLTPYHNLRF
jgi:hypothetical protein